MEVRKGYRQTDVGVIPEDWEVKPLSDLTKEIGDGIHATPEYVNSSDYFFINGNNLLNGQIVITENTMCVSSKEYRRLRKSLDNSTILMSINGTIGNLAFFNDEKVVLGKSAAYISANQKASKKFLYYTLQSNATKTFYENELTGTTIRNLSLGSIRNTPIPHPSTLAEQEAIAKALSDADALIEAVEQLHTKKRQVKQGAMSELLSGKRRLPGFSGEWKETTLGEMGKIYRGVSYNPSRDLSAFDTNSTIRLLRSNNVQEATVVFADMQYVDASKVSADQIMRQNDVLICMANGSKNLVGKAGRFQNEDGYEYTFGAFMGCFRPNTQAVNPDFAFCLFLTEQYRIHISILLAGSSINNLTPTNVEAFVIRIPTDVNEQTAIAEILSDMDAEITALEEKLVKARQVKAGMMSELLTGKIRLNRD